MRNLLRRLLATILILAPLSDAGASPLQAPEQELKAEFIKRFTLFVEWPEKAWLSDDAPFVVAVLGNDSLGSALDSRFLGRSVDGHRVVVRRIHLGELAGRYHLLYIAPDAAEHLSSILAQTAARPILTVADRDGAAREGVQINLLVVEGKLRFEVNQEAVQSSGLVFSPKLLRLARPVERVAKR